MQGADADALIAMIDRLDAAPVARLYDTSIAYQLSFRRAEGLDLQDEAVSASPFGWLAELAASQLLRASNYRESPARCISLSECKSQEPA